MSLIAAPHPRRGIRFVAALVVAAAFVPGVAGAGSSTNEDTRYGISARLVLNFNSKTCDGWLKYQVTSASQRWTRSRTDRRLSASHGRFGTVGFTQCDNETFYTNSRGIGRNSFDWILRNDTATPSYNYRVRWNYTGPPGGSEHFGTTSGWQHSHVTDGNDAQGAICVIVVLMGTQSCHD